MHTRPHRSIVTLLALGLAAAAPLAAQTVDKVVARHIEARGGAAKIRALQTIRMTGTISFGPGGPAPPAGSRRRWGRGGQEKELMAL